MILFSTLQPSLTLTDTTQQFNFCFLQYTWRVFASVCKKTTTLHVLQMFPQPCYCTFKSSLNKKKSIQAQCGKVSVSITLSHLTVHLGTSRIPGSQSIAGSLSENTWIFKLKRLIPVQERLQTRAVVHQPRGQTEAILKFACNRFSFFFHHKNSPFTHSLLFWKFLFLYFFSSIILTNSYTSGSVNFIMDDILQLRSYNAVVNGKPDYAITQL